MHDAHAPDKCQSSARKKRKGINATEEELSHTCFGPLSCFRPPTSSLRRRRPLRGGCPARRHGVSGVSTEQRRTCLGRVARAEMLCLCALSPLSARVRSSRAVRCRASSSFVPHHGLIGTAGAASGAAPPASSSAAVAKVSSSSSPPPPPPDSSSATAPSRRLFPPPAAAAQPPGASRSRNNPMSSSLCHASCVTGANPPGAAAPLEPPSPSPPTAVDAVSAPSAPPAPSFTGTYAGTFALQPCPFVVTHRPHGLEQCWQLRRGSGCAGGGRNAPRRRRAGG